DKNRVVPIWCPGCGDFGVLQSLTRALQELGRKPRDTVIVSGIGCSGRLPYFLDAYGFHTLHGRALPVALGVKMANPDLTVIVVGGDGDGFGIGGGHVPHIARRNVDITYLILDNGVYALTKGHSSPTTSIGQRTPSARTGESSRPLDIVGMLLAYRTSFVGSGWSGDRPQLTGLIREAIEHPGFAALHIYSPCPTYNEDLTFDTIRESSRPLPDDHDRYSLAAAMAAHYEADTPLTGIIYQESGSAPMLPSAANGDAEARLMSIVNRYA
ncbi:MAG: 2-oxoacid:ferredoxin oxidoreductase subunit beta, partial [Calditrichaeota bacterium]|nr:2-oxoacid:ferredoxin oxidoreductase subunit beta [Calditrichota bacterium]